jgi:hypothetical protein
MKYSLRSLMKFSIRDLLWLMIVAALAVGWWVNRQRLAARDETIRGLKTTIKEVEQREQAAIAREEKASDELWRRKHNPHPMETRRLFPSELP